MGGETARGDYSLILFLAHGSGFWIPVGVECIDEMIQAKTIHFLCFLILGILPATEGHGRRNGYAMDLWDFELGVKFFRDHFISSIFQEHDMQHEHAERDYMEFETRHHKIVPMWMQMGERSRRRNHEKETD